MIERAKLGDEYLAEAREYATKQAIRYFGPEKGTAIAEGLKTASIDDIKSATKSWELQADEKFGILQDGTAPKRVSADTDKVKVAVNAEDDAARPVVGKLLKMSTLGRVVLQRQKEAASKS